MDFMDQYGIQLFGDSSDDDETYLVSNPRKIKATSMRKFPLHIVSLCISYNPAFKMKPNNIYSVLQYF